MGWAGAALKARKSDRPIKGLTGFSAFPKHRRPTRAQMAELVDALVSGTSAARRGGSSPLLGTSTPFGLSGRTGKHPKLGHYRRWFFNGVRSTFSISEAS